MALAYAAATKTARMNAVVTAIGASGFLKLYTAQAGTLLATFPLAATAGTVSGSVLTLSDANGATAGILNTTAVAGGTATWAELQTSASAVVATCSVGVGSGDLQMDNNVLANGQAATINSATITHA